MPTAPRDLLLHDIEEYMRTYITLCYGADSNAARGGGTVQQYLQGNGFNYGNRHTEVMLAAPLVHAYFNVDLAGRNTDIFGFSRDRVKVEIGPDDGSHTGVPMYLIPYREGNARGVKLPSQAQDGLAEVFAITAAQDGCTFEVFGATASPYCSHSNCKDKAANLRQDKMKDRVDKLHARFLQAEQAGNVGFAMPAGPTRSQFQNYSDNRGAPPDGPIRQVNYSDGAKMAVNGIANQSVKGNRVETGPFTHRRYHIRLTDQSRNEILGPQVGAGQVIARRRQGVWSFYFQEHASLYFHVVAVDKVGPKAERKRTTISTNNGKGADAILCSGKLWPNYTSQYLDLDDYN
ncbi:MAG: hypothetical protein HOQ10_16595 [Frateuria sp.]|uniref:hypothetical protein n=1 Tax=Frateuria sp. TaxID=2211372 RepID=UPI0017B1DC16|nr:hypothetical protein [Frateuria sp.]NUO74314.1 hypothetical protein [Frateuria sp.]NUR21978.1 hypothetical protein [Frateuria sp.]